MSSRIVNHLKFLTKTLTTTALVASALAPLSVQAQSTVARPPQFILFSFDGSYNLGVWKNIRDFSKAQKDKGADTRFTFFISGVYFIQPSNRTVYQAPGKVAGKSDIGVGDSTDDIALRIDQVNKALSEKHEMGSHANGHYSGGKWSEADWTSEFTQFENMIFNVFSLNKIDPNRPTANGWLMEKRDIKGFRAPLLETSAGLWPTMKKFEMTFDASRTAEPNYWPEKLSTGLWNFPLAQIKIVGTAKKTLSMDYNFYVSQSGGKDDLANKETYKKQMYDSYIAWFQSNYNGNRAPLNIGHHFSKWNGSIYMEALQQFAADVCGLPEVRCVTYSEHVQWLESLQPQVLADIRRGKFDRIAKPIQLAAVVPEVNTTVKLATRASDGDTSIFVRPNVQQMGELNSLRARISINGQMLNQAEMTMAEIRQRAGGDNNATVTAHLYNNKGVEISRSTQLVHDIQGHRLQLSTDTQEARALKGDLPEAHLSEKADGYDPSQLD